MNDAKSFCYLREYYATKKKWHYVSQRNSRETNIMNKNFALLWQTFISVAELKSVRDVENEKLHFLGSLSI